MSAVTNTPNAPLLSCPFCGGCDLHAEGDSALDGCWSIMCDNPECEAEGPPGQASPDAAAEAWNKRASEADIIAGLLKAVGAK